jgi:hypothetical protein
MCFPRRLLTQSALPSRLRFDQEQQTDQRGPVAKLTVLGRHLLVDRVEIDGWKPADAAKPWGPPARPPTSGCGASGMKGRLASRTTRRLHDAIPIAWARDSEGHRGHPPGTLHVTPPAGLCARSPPFDHLRGHASGGGNRDTFRTALAPSAPYVNWCNTDSAGWFESVLIRLPLHWLMRLSSGVKRLVVGFSTYRT